MVQMAPKKLKYSRESGSITCTFAAILHRNAELTPKPYSAYSEIGFTERLLGGKFSLSCRLNIALTRSPLDHVIAFSREGNSDFGCQIFS